MLLDAVRRFLAEHAISECGIVVAVSGGADSTALLLTFAALRGEGVHITCAHVNHHLRGAESDEDEAWVARLCHSLDVPLEIADGSVPQELIRQHGLEAAAREVRSGSLLAIRERVGAQFVATGHQKNDQAETVLMRLFTGTGLAGLRGIHPLRADGFIRPFLEVSRDAIDAFLSERGITPRSDRMNADPRFLRTRVRQILGGLDPSVTDNLAATARQAHSRWDALEAALTAIEEVEITGDETRFLSMPSDPAVRQALLHRHIRRLQGGREVSEADLRRLAGEIDSLKRVSVTGSLELLRQSGHLVLRRKPEPTHAYEFAMAAGEDLYIPAADRVLRISATEEPVRWTGRTLACRGPRHTSTVSFNEPCTQPFQLPVGSEASFVVRNRRDGDRFRPLGAGGGKKLKDFLIDRKVPVEQRDMLPLLVWNGEIVWVAGVEISETFRLTDWPGSRFIAEIGAAAART